MKFVLLSLGVSVDAFAVALSKGLAARDNLGRQAMVTGLWFGGFQLLMPLLGYLLGAALVQQLGRFYGWAAGILLLLMGGELFREARCPEADQVSASLSPAVMLPMAIATSIDAMAVGVTLGTLPQQSILCLAFLMGLTTFTCSHLGVKLGCLCGLRWKTKAELAGAALLVLLALKILLELL